MDTLTYYNKVTDFLKPLIKEHNDKFTNELRTFYNRIASFKDPLSEFENEGRKFDNIYMEFTLLYKKPLTLGAKITQRYGKNLFI
jgi:hypothetical protein